MINTKEATNILNCLPPQITRYAKDGRLILEKQIGKDKYYTTESVEAIRLKKYPDGKPIILKEKKTEKKFEKKEIEKKSKKEIEKSFTLNKIGNQVMADTIDELKSLGLYRENDNYAILDYAMFYQMAMKQTILASENATYWDHKQTQHITADAKLAISYTKILDQKRKQLGLDPAGRSKLTIKEKKDLSEMADLING